MMSQLCSLRTISARRLSRSQYCGPKNFQQYPRNLSTVSPELYPEHVPLTCFQRNFLAAGSGILTFLNPYRDVTDTRVRPRIRTSTVDMDYLRSLPDGTFGKSYTQFMDRYGYSPDARRLVRFVDNTDLAYIMQRYREIHDMLHTLLEQPTDMLGEVVVKWVEALQTGLPMCLSGAYFGALRLGEQQQELYFSTHLNYALHVGLNSKDLMCVYYEKHWEDNVNELRQSLNIPPPPIAYNSSSLFE